MSSNLEVEKVPTETPVPRDGENTDSTASDAPISEETTFDIGLVSWLQVLGSFFLFFNSWYVVFARTFSMSVKKLTKVLF